MEPQELMVKRYIVENLWPGCPFEVGEIITPENCTRCIDFILYDEKLIKKYPYLFRKLEWWQDRDIKDMPEYVKLENQQDEIEVHKVVDWNERNGMPYIKGFGLFIVKDCLPATLADYTEYIDDKKS